MCAQQICIQRIFRKESETKVPGGIGLPEALPKQMARSDHTVPAAPVSTATVLHLLFPRGSIVLAHHRLLRPVWSQWPLFLGLRAHSCNLFVFEEQAPLGHGQPEGGEKSHAYDPQTDSIDVEEVYSCGVEVISVRSNFEAQFSAVPL